MGQQTIPALKNKFADGKTPTGSDFGDVFDSYLHKSTRINQSQVLGLNDELNSKATKKDLETIAAGLIYRPKVPTVADLVTIYPNAEKGWAAKVTADGYIYQYDGATWNNTGLKAFPDDVATLEDIEGKANQSDLMQLETNITYNNFYSWNLDGFSSYLLKSNFSFLNANKGEYIMVFTVPQNTEPNQMLFHIGEFMVTINGGFLQVYHRLGGGSSGGANIVTYAGKKIILRLIVDRDGINNPVMYVNINGEVKGAFNIDDITPSNSHLYIGSYQGSTLFSSFSFFSLTVVNGDKTILSILDYNNTPDTTNNSQVRIYDEDKKVIEKDAELICDGISAYLELNAENIVSAGNVKETFLFDLKLPNDVAKNQVLACGESSSLMLQINGGRLILGKSGIAGMYSANIGSFSGKRIRLIIIRDTTSFSLNINGVDVPLDEMSGYLELESCSAFYIGGLKNVLNSEITLYSFMKLNRVLSLDEVQNYDFSFLMNESYVSYNNDKIGINNWADIKSVGNSNMYNCEVKYPRFVYTSQSVIENKLLNSFPSELYVCVNQEANIYWSNVINGYENNYVAELAIDGSYIRNMDKCLRINYPIVGDYQGILNLYSSNGTLLESKAIVIKSRALNAGSGTLQFLFVGDSTIDDALIIDGQPYYDHEGAQIVKMFYDLSSANKGYTPLMIGHKRDYPPYFHAGMSGWASSSFLNSSSPFWYNGKNNFKNYVQTQIQTIPGATDRIDYLIYQIGINDLKNNVVTPEEVITNIKNFIGQFSADYPDAKIIVGFPALGNDTTGYSVHFYGTSSYMLFTTKMKKLHQLMLESFDNGSFAENVYICNAGQWIDRVYGFPYKNVPTSSRSTVEVMEHWDSVHPNADGYNQMADAYFARIKSLVSNII